MMDIDAAVAGRQEPVEERFVCGLPHLAAVGAHIEVQGMRGEVIAILDYGEYLDEWLAAGLPESWVSYRRPRCYVRCRRIAAGIQPLIRKVGSG